MQDESESEVEIILKAYLEILGRKIIAFGKQKNKEAQLQLVKDSFNVRKALIMWRYRDYYKFDVEKWKKDLKQGEWK